jgi:hypothetical protein
MTGERAALLDLHAGEKEGVLAARVAKQPRGMLAFLSRITGIKAFMEARQVRQDVARAKAHKAELATLAALGRRPNFVLGLPKNAP